MVKHLFGPNPSSQPVFVQYQLDPWEQSVKVESKYMYNFYARGNKFENIVSKWWNFCLGLNVLI